MPTLRIAIQHAGSYAGTRMEKKLLEAYSLSEVHHQECAQWMENTEHEEEWDAMIERHRAEMAALNEE